MTDKQIIQRLQSRDETGLAALQQAYGEGALSLALRITGSREDAQECLQDALMGVWESVPPQCPASLRAYLIALTRNAALDLLRSERREKRGGGAAELALEELSDFVSGPDSVEQEAEARLLGERINEFLGALSARDREIFVRRYYYFEELPEIAAACRLPKRYVSVVLHRTRKKLKAFLIKEEFL